MNTPAPRNAKEWKAMQRAEAERAYSEATAAFEALRERYGTVLSPQALEDALRVLDERHTTAPATYGKHPEYGIPCAIETIDGQTHDMAIVVFGGAGGDPGETYAVGGQVARVLHSRFALPESLVEAAQNTDEYRMGAYTPLLTRGPDGTLYLVDHGASFFDGGAAGSELDPHWHKTPSMGIADREGVYHTGNDTQSRIVTVVCDRLPS